MRTLTLILSLLLLSCGHASKDEASPSIPSAIVAEAAALTPQALANVPACDLATFAYLIDPSFTSEVVPGYPLRNPKVDCLTESGSDSSLDVNLAAFHAAVSKGDRASVVATLALAPAPLYPVGIGPITRTSILPLIPLMHRFATGISPIPGAPTWTADIAHGFRAHLVGIYLWTKFSVCGLATSDRTVLDQLAIQNPDSLVLAALSVRFGSGSLDSLLTRLSIFASDPLAQAYAEASWGSSTWRFHYVMAVRILQGY